MIQKTLNEFSSPVMKFNMNSALAFMIQKTLNESDVMKFNMTHCFGLHDSEDTQWIQQSSHEVQHEFGFGLHDSQDSQWIGSHWKLCQSGHDSVGLPLIWTSIIKKTTSMW